ncbi:MULTISPECIES: tetratricopeptide repeat-containing sulfotransferase family protein [Thiorhodovibrio]|uniref:tetratricopeptide repeat-containing sulfotransferase family protein n=1 Tax=Thiorhodovibrio TaxID=61593 RepID=UPI0019114D44|nr:MULTISPECIES: tetratricopeptide repeat-containing sulfotransferase family protein [Thiorhodovibrio]WPL15090.1 putative PEP-CTERM system TPR-repeat lipoprotein [Thiorhodovibrio litoralis]
MTPTKPALEELRAWQRQLEDARVVEALAGREALSPAEATVLALARWRLQPTAAAADLAAVPAPASDDALWLSDAALAALVSGERVQAEQWLRAAIALPEATAVEYGRLGAVELVAGALEEAAAHYREAVRREPERAEWHNNLAGLLVRLQQLEEALEHYDLALTLKAALPEAQQGRARVLMALERTAELAAELQRALDDQPEDVGLRLRLARALTQDKRPGEAVSVLRDALLPPEESPKPATLAAPGATPSAAEQQWREQLLLRRELLHLLRARDHHLLVLRVIAQLERLEAPEPEVLIGFKVHALSELGRHEQAAEVLEQASATHGDHVRLRMARAALLAERGQYQDAETLLRELLEIYPGDGGLKTQLGQVLLWTGQLKEAGALFEEAARHNPLAFAQMVNARQMPQDPKAIEAMERVADNSLLPDDARVTMAFALHEVLDKAGDYARAFHYLHLANRLSDKVLNYDPAAFSRRVDGLIEAYSPAFFARQAPIRASDRTPVFVVGMPRSGTTLTEQILSSHPAIFGAGELDLMPRLAQLLPAVIKKGRPYPTCLGDFTPDLREEAVRFYLKGLKQHDSEHPYVVDKMPHNFMHLGLIALIFPGAKIIHVQRDPRDTALSNYQQNFKAKHAGMGYAFDLVKIGRQINDYQRIMRHWRAVLPLRIFEFRYEDLVADQEIWSRRLLEFVGVGWDAQVASFHETKRAVRTASVSQVRQPMYQSSTAKWRRYEASLAPLLEILEVK